MMLRDVSSENITSNSDNFAYITGNLPEVSHRRIIDSGAFGEVHEIYDRRDRKVFHLKECFGANEYRFTREKLCVLSVTLDGSMWRTKHEPSPNYVCMNMKT